MATRVSAVGKPELPPFMMSDRFRHEITYFMSIPGQAGPDVMPPGEYWISLAQSKVWLEEGVFSLVSPLDSENQTEIELSEEQEDWFQWMVVNEIEHVRIH